MKVIDPEPGAIENFLWVKAQEGIKLAFELVRDAQVAINPDYDFDVLENKYRPTIEEIEDKAFVNIIIESVLPGAVESNFNKIHVVTYNMDCYVRGKNEDHGGSSLVPADDVAVQRLQYLCAMVLRGVTSLAGFYKSLNSGEIIPGKISMNFSPVDDASESFTPYAPARIQFVCQFPYTPQDLENLPDLVESFQELEQWTQKLTY